MSLFSLMKKVTKKNQERTPTPIFFGSHSARTPEKIVVHTVRSRPRAILPIFPHQLSLYAFTKNKAKAL
jgi:hypothetical protein